MRFDLHIHSCLSPCANLEMAPSEIVARAAAVGMDGIALTDHQSARNCPAIAECARRAGLKCLFGLEVQTAEEVHTLALFDTVDQALAMTEWVYAAMPKRVNDPETFGDQPVVTWDDDIVEMEWRILAMGCRRTIPETATKIHELGGLYIAAHVDRANHSVLGALGSIPEPMVESERQPDGGRFFDAIELSRTADETAWLPKVGDYAVTRSSDAHNIDDVARVWTEADGEFSVAGLKAIFAANRRISHPASPPSNPSTHQPSPMTFQELTDRVSGTIIVDNPSAAISSAYTSDLLSDVMGHCGDESVLITIQNHLNAIAVCTLAGIEAIVLCHGRAAPDDMKEAAAREGVGIIETNLSQFEASVKLADLRPSAR